MVGRCQSDPVGIIYLGNTCVFPCCRCVSHTSTERDSFNVEKGEQGTDTPTLLSLRKHGHVDITGDVYRIHIFRSTIGRRGRPSIGNGQRQFILLRLRCLLDNVPAHWATH